MSASGYSARTSRMTVNIVNERRSSHLISTPCPRYISATMRLANRMTNSPSGRPRKVRAQGPGNGKKHHRSRAENGKLFRAGDVVRETGIYEVIHASTHRAAHEVVMHKSDLFPDCDTCQREVRFRLIRTAPYIFEDADFEPEP
jgi:hypothetical protein